MTGRRPLKFVVWNVNGIRACAKRGFGEWFLKQKADFICLQEIKSSGDQLGECFRPPKGYSVHFHQAQKPGYSGVAIFCKNQKPMREIRFVELEEADREGRFLALEFDTFVLINAYFPNSQRTHARLSFKLQYCDRIEAFCDSVRSQNKNVVLCGDFNIAHHDIDLKNPVSNRKNAGFLPAERGWLTRFLSLGYVDTFRSLYPQKIDQFTWWSNLAGCRERNIGWRLDYFVVNRELEPLIESVKHQSKVLGSDHCPVQLWLRL